MTCGLTVCLGAGFRVVGGLDTLDKVERIEVDKKDKPKVNRTQDVSNKEKIPDVVRTKLI